MDSYSLFEELYKDNHGRLVNFAMNLLNDREAAKDVVQEVFIKLWNRRGEIEFGPLIISYLYKATTNTALNYLETRKRKQKLSKDLVDSVQEQSTADVDMEAKELQLKIRKAIDNLPPKCRVIFILSRQEGKKYKEIAEELDISIKTVDNQMGIALKKIRDELKDYLSRDSAITIFVTLIANLVLGV